MILALSLAATATGADVVGDLRLHQFESRVFGNVRTLRVLVPPDYDAPTNRTRRYPVLYLGAQPDGMARR